MATIRDKLQSLLEDELEGHFVRAVDPYIKGYQLVLQGDLYIDENEGGFAPMFLEIDGQDLSVAITKWAKAYDSGRPYSVKNEHARIRNVKITVEVV